MKLNGILAWNGVYDGGACSAMGWKWGITP